MRFWSSLLVLFSAVAALGPRRPEEQTSEPGIDRTLLRRETEGVSLAEDEVDVVRAGSGKHTAGMGKGTHGGGATTNQQETYGGRGKGLGPGGPGGPDGPGGPSFQSWSAGGGGGGGGKGAITDTAGTLEGAGGGGGAGKGGGGGGGAGGSASGRNKPWDRMTPEEKDMVPSDQRPRRRTQAPAPLTLAPIDNSYDHQYRPSRPTGFQPVPSSPFPPRVYSRVADEENQSKSNMSFRQMPPFEDLDLNNNGRIAPEEYKEVAKKWVDDIEGRFTNIVSETKQHVIIDGMERRTAERAEDWQKAAIEDAKGNPAFESEPGGEKDGQVMEPEGPHTRENHVPPKASGVPKSVERRRRTSKNVPSLRTLESEPGSGPKISSRTGKPLKDVTMSGESVEDQLAKFDVGIHEGTICPHDTVEVESRQQSPYSIPGPAQSFCMDVFEHEFASCEPDDAGAWAAAEQTCFERKRVLCSDSQYIRAYSDGKARQKMSLEKKHKYAYTSTSQGCPPTQHAMMEEKHGKVYGCYPDTGCWPNRYFRCCVNVEVYKEQMANLVREMHVKVKEETAAAAKKRPPPPKPTTKSIRAPTTPSFRSVTQPGKGTDDSEPEETISYSPYALGPIQPEDGPPNKPVGGIPRKYVHAWFATGCMYLPDKSGPWDPGLDEATALNQIYNVCVAAQQHPSSRPMCMGPDCTDGCYPTCTKQESWPLAESDCPQFEYNIGLGFEPTKYRKDKPLITDCATCMECPSKCSLQSECIKHGNICEAYVYDGNCFCKLRTRTPIVSAAAVFYKGCEPRLTRCVDPSFPYAHTGGKAMCFKQATQASSSSADCSDWCASDLSLECDSCCVSPSKKLCSPPASVFQYKERSAKSNLVAATKCSGNPKPCSGSYAQCVALGMTACDNDPDCIAFQVPLAESISWRTGYYLLSCMDYGTDSDWNHFTKQIITKKPMSPQCPGGFKLEDSEVILASRDENALDKLKKCSDTCNHRGETCRSFEWSDVIQDCFYNEHASPNDFSHMGKGQGVTFCSKMRWNTYDAFILEGDGDFVPVLDLPACSEVCSTIRTCSAFSFIGSPYFICRIGSATSKRCSYGGSCVNSQWLQVGDAKWQTLVRPDCFWVQNVKFQFQCWTGKLYDGISLKRCDENSLLLMQQGGRLMTADEESCVAINDNGWLKLVPCAMDADILTGVVFEDGRISSTKGTFRSIDEDSVSLGYAGEGEFIPVEQVCPSMKAVEPGEMLKQDVTGKKDCECVPVDPGGLVTGNEGFAGIAVEIDDKTYTYPLGLGTYCRAWDENIHPECTGAQKAAFCRKRWCFVDPCTCTFKVSLDRAHYMKDITYHQAPLHYSYETCGAPPGEASSVCSRRTNKQNCEKEVSCAWTGTTCMMKSLAIGCETAESTSLEDYRSQLRDKTEDELKEIAKLAHVDSRQVIEVAGKEYEHEAIVALIVYQQFVHDRLRANISWNQLPAPRRDPLPATRKAEDAPDEFLKQKISEMGQVNKEIVERHATVEDRVRKFEDRRVNGMSEAQAEENRIRNLIKQNQKAGIAELSKSRKVHGIWFASQKANKNCRVVCKARGLTCDPDKLLNHSDMVDTRVKIAGIFEDLELPCHSVTMQDRMEASDMRYLPSRRVDGAWCQSTTLPRDENNMDCDAVPPASGEEEFLRLCFCSYNEEKVLSVWSGPDEADAEELAHRVGTASKQEQKEARDLPFDVIILGVILIAGVASAVYMNWPEKGASDEERLKWNGWCRS